MGKSTISMAISNSYVKLPEGTGESLLNGCWLAVDPLTEECTEKDHELTRKLDAAQRERAQTSENAAGSR